MAIDGEFAPSTMAAGDVVFGHSAGKDVRFTKDQLPTKGSTGDTGPTGPTGATGATGATYAPPHGTFTANGATPVTVTNANVTANSAIPFALKTIGGTVGAYPAIQTITATTGFTVVATAGDTSVYNYSIIN